MAITQVGGQNAGALTDSGTSVSKAFPAALTPNNLVSVVCAKFSPSNDAFLAGDCTKSAGTATVGSITLDASVNFNYTGANFLAVGVWSCAISSSGSCTIQVGGAAAGSALLLAIDEFTSPNGQITFDTGKTATGTGTSTAATASAAITPSTYNGLIIGGVGTATSGATTHTPNSSFTQIFEEENGSLHMTGNAAYQVLTSGSATASWGLGASVSWAVAAAGYIEPAASTGGAAHPVPCLLPMLGCM